MPRRGRCDVVRVVAAVAEETAAPSPYSNSRNRRQDSISVHSPGSRWPQDRGSRVRSLPVSWATVGEIVLPLHGGQPMFDRKRKDAEA
jgi:hypothetical protein